MSDPAWTAVDQWTGEKLIGDDPAFQAIIDANSAAGLPSIDVSPAQGKLLHLLIRIAGAGRVLEVGTLGGYSTAWMARALPENGQIVTLEINPNFAKVARANLQQLGVSDCVEIRLGSAIESLEQMVEEGEDPFDFVFLDADKENNANYLRLALALSRPGTVIVCDNVVRQGRVIEPAQGDQAIAGTRALFDELRGNSRLTATAVQTVGLKGWDGFALAIVEAPQ
jgi:predicted O-methyltransferase YrrM